MTADCIAPFFELTCIFSLAIPRNSTKKEVDARQLKSLEKAASEVSTQGHKVVWQVVRSGQLVICKLGEHIGYEHALAMSESFKNLCFLVIKLHVAAAWLGTGWSQSRGWVVPGRGLGGGWAFSNGPGTN